VLGLSDADFWDMTPRSYAAIQRAWGRIHGGAEQMNDDDPGDGATQARIFGHFTALAGQQQAGKAANGASSADR
jgi:hypothetical protein